LLLPLLLGSNAMGTTSKLSSFNDRGMARMLPTTPPANGAVMNRQPQTARGAAGNGNGAPAQPFSTYAVPTINSVAPNPGGLGQSITIAGNNLGTSTTSTVTINGINAPVISNSGTSLVVRVPTTATAGSNPIIVKAGNGNNNTSTPYSNFTVMAASGNVLAFDGTDDYLSLPTSTAVPINNSPYTLEAWIKPTSMNVNGIIGWGNYGTTNQVNALRLTSTGLVNYWWNNDLDVTTSNLVDGHWHHVAATFNGTTRILYVDGALVGQDQPTGHAVPDASNLAIGVTDNSAAGNGFEYYQGSIDQVRVYSVALTLAQLQADMVSTTAAVPASLVLYYNFDQGTPATTSTGANTGLTTLYDLANATPATLNNFALASGTTTSNYVASYAMVVPAATATTSQTTTSFVANWTAPAVGAVTSYVLDVATTASFANPVTGSPFSVASSATSKAVTGLNNNSTYYYRVRALNSALAQPDQGAYSNTTVVSAPLPVELSAFTATATGPAAVRLAWRTASEKNSDRFEVERSQDGQTFAVIGRVAAAGTSLLLHTYELLDGKLPPATTLYYRLRQVDADGTASYSPVRAVRLNDKPTAGLTLAPNPAHVTTLTGAETGAPVEVYDARGRLVHTTTADAAGTAALVLPTGLASGVYVVRSGSQSVRLVIE